MTKPQITDQTYVFNVIFQIDRLNFQKHAVQIDIFKFQLNCLNFQDMLKAAYSVLMNIFRKKKCSF